MKIKDKTITGKTTRYSITVSIKERGDIIFTATIEQWEGYDITSTDITLVEATFNATQEEIDEATKFANMNL